MFQTAHAHLPISSKRGHFGFFLYIIFLDRLNSCIVEKLEMSQCFGNQELKSAELTFNIYLSAPFLFVLLMQFSPVNKGFHFLVLRNSSEFNKPFLNVFVLVTVLNTNLISKTYLVGHIIILFFPVTYKLLAHVL